MQTITARIVLAICFLSLAATDAKAQSHSTYIEPAGWSMGVNVGMSDLWGDVGTKSVLYHYDNSAYAPKAIGGLYAKYSVHPSLAVRFSVNYGTLYATDKWNKDLAKTDLYLAGDAVQRYSRYQDIKDIMWEGSVLFEFTPFRTIQDYKLSYKVGQPYIVAGVAYFHYTPYSLYYAPGAASDQSSRYVDIANLHLEGDGWGSGYPPTIKYWQFAVPVGIGYRWDMGLHLNMGFEYLYRFTFTDYLDMVSGKYVSDAAFEAHEPNQAALAEAMADKSYVHNLLPANEAGNLRGNPNNKDSYSTISLIFYWKVKNRTKPWWGDWFY